MAGPIEKFVRQAKASFEANAAARNAVNVTAPRGHGGGTPPMLVPGQLGITAATAKTGTAPGIKAAKVTF